MDNNFCIASNKYIYLLLLLVLSSLYYSFFMFSVIPMQTGWWQYYAFCLTKGALLYKDVFLFLPPYFAWFTGLLYLFFKNNFFLYTIFGFIVIRCIGWSVLYLILNRITTPLISFVGVFMGVCITSTYLMDQVYDYNPAIFTVLIILVYLFIRLHENRKNRKLIFFIGCNVGILIMTKQTIGVVIPLVCLFLLWLMYKDDHYKNKVLFFILGVCVTSLPGVVYLLHTDTFFSMISCLQIATSAKLANANIMWVMYRFIVRIKIFIFVCMAFFLLNNNGIIKNKTVLNGMYCVTGVVFGLIIERYIIPGIKFIPYIGINNIFVLIASLVLACAMFIKYQNKQVARSSVIVLSILLGVGLYIVSFSTNDVASFVYYGMSWRILTHDILYFSFYVNCIICIYYCNQYRNNCNEKNVIYVFIAFILGTTVFIGGLSSSELEPYIGLLVVPLAVVSFLQYGSENVNYHVCIRLKNVIFLFVCAILVFLCLITKMFIPYEWHGWKVSSILNSNNVKIVDDIPGLNGYKLAISDYNSYKLLHRLISDNTSHNAFLYQFPNIPLFNVLVEQKSYYVPILYFDVCPDSMALFSVKELQQYNPDLFLWADFEEGRWRVHEEIFRGGKLSGQREIKKFYEEEVLSNYTCLGVVDNNEGGTVELWKKK